jgi:hypothetical protein
MNAKVAQPVVSLVEAAYREIRSRILGNHPAPASSPRSSSATD